MNDVDGLPSTVLGLASDGGIHLETNAKAALGLILGATLMLAFSMRLGVRLAFGEDYFWSNSYFDYYRLAQNIISGN